MTNEQSFHNNYPTIITKALNHGNGYINNIKKFTAIIIVLVDTKIRQKKMRIRNPHNILLPRSMLQTRGIFLFRFIFLILIILCFENCAVARLAVPVNFEYSVTDLTAAAAEPRSVFIDAVKHPILPPLPLIQLPPDAAVGDASEKVALIHPLKVLQQPLAFSYNSMADDQKLAASRDSNVREYDKHDGEDGKSGRGGK